MRHFDYHPKMYSHTFVTIANPAVSRCAMLVLSFESTAYLQVNSQQLAVRPMRKTASRLDSLCSTRVIESQRNSTRVLRVRLVEIEGVRSRNHSLDDAEHKAIQNLMRAKEKCNMNY